MIGVIVAVVLWAVYFSVSITGKGNFSQRATVFTMNLFLPYKLSKAMSMDKVEIISPTEMQFNFTMLAMDRSAVSDTSALIALWKPMLVKSMHKNSGNEYYRKNHVKLICCIADKYGKYMFRIPITPADYDTYR